MVNKIINAEYEAAAKLQHENLVKYLEYKDDVILTLTNGTQLEEHQCCYFLNELIDGENLMQVIMMREEPMDEGLCRFYFKQMLEVLQYMHS